MVILLYVSSIIMAYLLGSVNFAIIITKLVKGTDIRKYGSGNAGFTNVLRSVGKVPAIFTLIGDFSKGILSVIIVRLLFHFFAPEQSTMIATYLVCYAALLGHLFPIFYDFKGGKGILVSFGAIMILSPIAGLISFAGFLITLAISRYVSLGSIIAAVIFTTSTACITVVTKSIPPYEWVLTLPISGMIVFMHRENIKRLLNHTENKISIKKK